ncbi:MAG: S8 family serine peptidase [Planctomycetes bacterium]|nr:S8 family serine peptidase [Planctomycetota bacterium]
MKILLAALFLSVPVLTASAQAELGERVSVPGQLVVCFESASTAVDLQAELERWNLAAAAPGLRIESSRSLLQWTRRGESRVTNVVLIEYSPARVAHETLTRRLSSVGGIEWSAPNTALEGDPREVVPNDPSYGLQYHHPKMQNDLAWNTTFGSASVIMGITDDGVDLDHPDLVQNIWVNPGEVAANGIDDDGNGYVDDVTGWDFVFVGNDPNPNGTDGHGTHVAGIAGARTNNGVGVAGTAGGSTIMPLQFYSTGQAWTAAKIAESFAYGVDNGARILSTSYNMDGWVSDPTVLAAFDYIYDAGALHFNSAGNNSALNPPRQAFHQSLLVASTDSADVKSSFSNYGDGVDIAAPGSSIYATLVGGGYGTMSGTSMAAPNAAGSAALVWSAHPTWTRDQVASALCFFADNIDAQNPTYVGLIGGRANAYRAMTLSMPAPKVKSVTGLPADGATLSSALTGFELRFDQILDPTAVNAPGAFTLEYAGADGVFGTADDNAVSLAWDEYLISSNRVRFSSVGAMLGSGAYHVSANAAVLQNPFGTALDGNGDGSGGDSWTRTFYTCGTNTLLVDNCESGVGWSVAHTNLTDGPWGSVPEVPVGGGVRNDPATDFDGSGRCFLTDNVVGNSDVDGGPTRLTSRAFDCTVSADPYISFARWFLSDGADVMTVEISNNDGSTWSPLATLTSVNAWTIQTYRVADFVSPSATVRLRFSVTDANPGNVVEAGIDYLRLLEIDCQNLPVGTRYCAATLNSTGQAARIGALGSTSVTDNDLTLWVDRTPAAKAGIFFFGPSQVQVPFGNGIRCVSGGTRRLGPSILTNAQGVALRVVDLTQSPAAGVIVPGLTSNFQFWFRDPSAGGSNFNLSDAVSITWQ